MTVPIIRCSGWTTSGFSYQKLKKLVRCLVLAFSLPDVVVGLPDDCQREDDIQDAEDYANGSISREFPHHGKIILCMVLDRDRDNQ